MKSINIKNSLGSCSIEIQRGMDLIDLVLSEPHTKIITDKNVFYKYNQILKDKNPIVIKPGEDSKSIYNFFRIHQKLLESGLDRTSKIIALGGGVVTDLAGFVASTFLRGVRFSYIPTTLLGMIDASIGGKNGINLNSYKNIVGSFNQPESIIINPEFLNTLPEIELRNGFSEVIKAGLIYDSNLINYINKNSDELLSLNQNYIDDLIYKSIKIKTDIVDQDSKETGIRKILNFGHTFGHAIESVHKIPHGQAISIGMMIETILSEKIGLENSKVDEVKSILEKFELPVNIDFNKDEIMEAIYMDKKKIKKTIDLVLLKDIGEAAVKNMEIFELGLFIKSL